MRKVKGTVSMCGRIAYCPQTAWIQNATLVSPLQLFGKKKKIHVSYTTQRDNIVFGQAFEEERVSYCFSVHFLPLIVFVAVLESRRER